MEILIGINPDGELWFLYCLFFISILIAILVKRVNLGLLIGSFLIGMLSDVLNIFSIAMISEILYFQFLFYLGIIYKEICAIGLYEIRRNSPYIYGDFWCR